MVAINLTKATYFLLLMLAVLILTGNIVLIQMSLQQNEKKETEIQLLREDCSQWLKGLNQTQYSPNYT